MVGKRQRVIVTRFGSFKFFRRLYKDDTVGGRFLLDEALGLKPRTQATPALENTVTELSSLMPFRQAAEILEKISGGFLSHQMVWNVLQRKGASIEEEEKTLTKNLTENGELPHSQGKRVPRLFVEADGTHIHLQREEKKNGELKLLVSHEGWKPLGNNRFALKDKRLLSGFHSAKDSWERFTLKLAQTYHPEVLSSLIIGGDGASWVKGGSELFQGSLYQLDRFHIKRALLRASGSWSSANQIYSHALKGDLPPAITLLNSLKEKSPEREGELQKAVAYLKSNSHGLIDYRERIKNPDPDWRGLGAIESNIDKVLANRMKKRGMSWTIKGAHHMAKVIQARDNGELEVASPTLSSYAGINLKKALITIKKNFEKAPGDWLQGRIPALSGPHQGRPWVKTLRNMSNLSSWEHNQGYSAY